MSLTQNQKELLAVAAVGAALAAAFRYLPVVSKYPIAAGTALYVVGYVARGQRPASGWPQLEG